MNYDEMTARQLQELCREHDLPTARDKATMIQRLTEADSAAEIEKFYGDAPAPLPDAVLPASEDELKEVDLKLATEPSQADSAVSGPDFWLTGEGDFAMRFPRYQKLTDREHNQYLVAVREKAEAEGFTTYGPPFRVNFVDDADAIWWLYRINVR